MKKPQAMLVAFEKLPKNITKLELIAQSTGKTGTRKTSLS